MTNRGDKQPAGGRRIETLAVLLIALGLFLRVLIGIQPPERLVSVCLADDAFYYLVIAEHIIAGDGSTFDGRVETNGYHPLWMAVAVAAVKLAGDAVPAARLLTLLLALIGTLNALLLWRLAARVAGPMAGLWAAGFWALNPYVYYTELAGVEAPLMIMFVLLSLHVYASLRLQENAGLRRWAGLGALVGLALLARTDAVLFAVVLAVDVMLARWWPVRGDRAMLKKRVVEGVLAAVAAVLVVLPWLLYNLASFGTIMQDSAAALIVRERIWLAAADGGWWLKAGSQFKMGLLDYFLRLAGLTNTAWLFGAVGLLLGAVLATRIATGERFWHGGEKLLGIVLAWGGLVWAFYILYFWQQKFWYFLPVTLLWGVAAALAAQYIWRGLRERRGAAILLLVVGLALLGNLAVRGARIGQHGYWPWQGVYLQAAEYIKEQARLEPDTKVAAMNSGILAAFSGLDVLNLDGVVNPDAREAIRDRDMLSYIRREQVTLLVDHAQLIGSYRAFADAGWGEQSFSLRHRFKTPPFSGDVVVLRVLPAGGEP